MQVFVSFVYICIAVGDLIIKKRGLEFSFPCYPCTCLYMYHATTWIFSVICRGLFVLSKDERLLIVLLILVQLITIAVYKKKFIITCCYLILNGWFMVLSTTPGHERGSNSPIRDDRHLL